MIVSAWRVRRGCRGVRPVRGHDDDRTDDDGRRDNDNDRRRGRRAWTDSCCQRPPADCPPPVLMGIGTTTGIALGLFAVGLRLFVATRVRRRTPVPPDPSWIVSPRWSLGVLSWAAAGGEPTAAKLSGSQSLRTLAAASRHQTCALVRTWHRGWHSRAAVRSGLEQSALVFLVPADDVAGAGGARHVLLALEVAV
jgi:hypothetical protein